MALFAGARTERSIRKLISAVQKNDNEAFNNAINKIASFGSDALPAIYDALDYTREEQAYDGLVQAIGRITNTSTLPLLLQGFEHDSTKVSQAISEALMRTRKINANALIPFLKDVEIPNNKIYPILEQRKEEIDPKLLISTSYDVEMNDKDEIFKILDDIVSPDLVPDLMSRATGKDPVVRGHIIRILSRFNDTRVVRTLEGLLNDKNNIVRQAALDSLTKLGNTADISSLCAMLEDKDFGVQERAVEAIVKLNHPNTAQHLLTVLKSENEYARRSAVEVLNEIGTVDHMKQLLTAILDEDWWVRARSADALSNIGGPKVVDAVMGLIKDDNEDIRRTAVEILVAAKDPRAEEQLVKSLDDSDWWVRERAADALAEMGSTKALNGLTKILGTHPKSDPIIIRAIGKLGNEYNVQRLLPYLNVNDDLIRLETIKALNFLTGKDTVKTVVGAYKKLATIVENQELKEEIRVGLRQLDREFFTILMDNNEESQLAPHVQDPSQMVVETGNLQVGQSPQATMLMDGKDIQAMIEEAPQGVLDIGKLKAGDLIDDRYKYKRKIGKGAFGTVVLVEDVAVGEDIILKFLNAHIASDEETMKRFVHELKFSRKITDPNVIRIFDFLKIRGVFAISMEYFPSKELADIINKKPLDPKRAARFGADICSGMAAAHRAGIIHRDLKPANVLVNNKDVVKVVDFGVAAAQSSGGTDLTKTGFVIGSPKYMAPEQILGKKVDPRADVYSTGVILYEMLTGKAPYTKGDHMAVMYQHVQGGAPAPHSLNPNLDMQLSEIAMKAMTVNRNKRYQTMDDLKSDLLKFV